MTHRTIHTLVGGLMDPMMVDRALRQTFDSGCLYAAIPEPSVLAWFEYVGWAEAQMVSNRAAPLIFRWWECCIAPDTDASLVSHDFDATPVDDEGNRLVCLLAKGHDGECGYNCVLTARSAR